MSNEQEQLVIEIVLRLREDAVTGAWPGERCCWCHGRSSGYDYSREFTHESGCIVLLCDRLERTLAVEGDLL